MLILSLKLVSGTEPVAQHQNNYTTKKDDVYYLHKKDSSPAPKQLYTNFFPSYLGRMHFRNNTGMPL